MRNNKRNRNTKKKVVAFFDASVAAGTLDDVGSFPGVKRVRLKAFRVLKHAYERSDGQVWPMD